VHCEPSQAEVDALVAGHDLSDREGRSLQAGGGRGRGGGCAPRGVRRMCTANLRKQKSTRSLPVTIFPIARGEACRRGGGGGGGVGVRRAVCGGCALRTFASRSRRARCRSRSFRSRGEKLAGGGSRFAGAHRSPGSASRRGL